MEDRKEKLLKAKSLVIQGATLKEASKETGLSIDVLKKQSSKENWIKSQIYFLQAMYTKLQEEHIEDHIRLRCKTIDYLEEITTKTMEDFEKGKILPDKAITVLMASIRGQAEILGLLSVEEIIKAEQMERFNEVINRKYLNNVSIKRKYNLN